MSTPDLTTELLSAEAAKYLGISVQRLSRLRRDHLIAGKKVGTMNLYSYQIADLRRLNTEKRKRGPKPKKTESKNA
ncbi:MAG: hypothetical protein ABI324_19675 [Ktedonobacteraceae bacterium]